MWRREGTFRNQYYDFSAGCSCALVNLMLLAMPASSADPVTLCHRALSADVLKYTDSQFKSTLCTASIVYQRAAKAGDHEAMSVCMKAIEKMIPILLDGFRGASRTRSWVGANETGASRTSFVRRPPYCALRSGALIRYALKQFRECRATVSC